MVHHQQMVGHRVKIIPVTVAFRSGAISPRAHFPIENTVTERLHGIYFIRAGGKAHAKIAGAQLLQVSLGEGRSVLG
jgi:hypothetical protein